MGPEILNAMPTSHQAIFLSISAENKRREKFRRNRNKDDDEFFHFESSQSDDVFMGSEESMKWS